MRSAPRSVPPATAQILWRPGLGAVPLADEAVGTPQLGNRGSERASEPGQFADALDLPIPTRDETHVTHAHFA